MIMESKTKTTRLTKTNSGSSSRFLHCFKPPEMDINDRSCVPVRPVRGCRGSFSHHEPVFTYVDVAEKPGVVFTGILSDDVGGGGNSQDQNGVVEKKKSQDQNGVVEKKKRGGSHGGRKLLRIMRAVMFETSLAKKIRKKKHKHKQWQSDKNGNSIQQEYTEDENGRTISRNSSSSRYSSAITSSSPACSSSLSSNARQRYSDGINLFRSNNSFDGKQKQDMSFNNRERRKGCSGPNNIGCCFLVISLFVLVFWGRVCAIVCTSTWLFFVPQRWRSSSIINGSSSKNVDAKLHSEKYKKKIIMEGLLERNHPRGL